MSWLFFVGEAVYKLKKPIKLPYLDYSTLARRETACRAEFILNQRLAPGVYQAVAPLVRTELGLQIGGRGETVDWLVLMRFLDQRRTLEARLSSGQLARRELDGLAELLAEFYRHARRRRRSPAAGLASWRALIAFNRRVLLEPRLGMPSGAVRYVLGVQEGFLRRRPAMLAARMRAGRIIDAHGDLRPEHIWMGPPIKIIDRLDFSVELRSVDPLDELAFLEVETERLGAPEAGASVSRRVSMLLRDRGPEELRLFYRSSRAMLRARLAIAHLLEPRPRTPARWPAQAREYLQIAVRDARRLERLLRRPADR